MSFPAWRRLHRISSGTVGLIALVHCAVTFFFYDEWSADPEPQAFLVVAGLIGQAIASFVTLPGSRRVDVQRAEET